jgi:shikimate dehydrogenase
MNERYAVIGNPVDHSRSPEIHAAFARATGQDIEYGRLLAPLDGFTEAVQRFRSEGGRGANVTVPFKEEAWRLVERSGILSTRARAARAVNTLRFDASGPFGDNTDGAGLVADLQGNLATLLAGRRILLLGAGGAARGVLHPLLTQCPAGLVLANRTSEKARYLVAAAAPDVADAIDFRASAFDDLRDGQFDVIVNATSASLAGEAPRLPSGIFAPGALAYDMMYSSLDTPFMAWARGQGAAQVCDGLGMLVEQAAESFFVWRGVRPDTAPVLAMLRNAR